MHDSNAATSACAAPELPRPTWQPMPGIEIERHHWGAYLTGTREAIQAHPDCPAGMFDGEGAALKVQRTVKGADGWMAVVTRTGRRYRFCLDATPEQRDELRAQCERAEKVGKELRRAERQIAELSASAAAFRQEAIEMFGGYAGLIKMIAEGRFVSIGGGYQLSEDAIESVVNHLWGIHAVFETGPVVFDEQVRQEQIGRFMQPVRAADPSFSDMLGKLTAGAVGQDD